MTLARFIQSILFLGLCAYGTVVSVSVAYTETYPKTANYFLKWSITDAEMRELAKWDLLVLDMENQVTNPERLRELRRLNPGIILLAYITPQEIRNDALGGPSKMRDRLARGISSEWYLANDLGAAYSFWQGTTMLNLAENAPEHNGKNFNEYLSHFVATEILGSGVWDGVFYDNAWKDLTWFSGTRVDYDRNGSPDTGIDQKWYEGMKKLYEDTRAQAPGDPIIIGNGHTRGYTESLNGKMIENFQNHPWSEIMSVYQENQLTRNRPTVNIINANTGNVENAKNYRSMRFGLTSALLENGYYSFDYGDKDHARLWNYDEYGVSLGDPLGSARSQTGKSKYAEDVWSRTFENGIAVVNSTGETRGVSLGGEYEKIHGTQDTEINNGAIVAEVTLAPKDGIILLKTFQTLKQIVFTNGFFARFFRADGERAKNGFFVFEEKHKGGAQIAHIDLDFNGAEELIVVMGNKIQAWRDDGQILFRLMPYGANYTGSLNVAVGDLNNDGFYEIYTAPSAGFREPIRSYNRHGNTLANDFFPFGNTYTGGYHISLTKATEKVPSRLIVGSGAGARPTITLFGYEYKKIHSFTAFETSFTGGVSVAAGDVDGDGVQEIIAGKGYGGKPTVRVFSLEGKEKYKSFDAYSTVFKPGVEVRALDIDFDGIDEIVTLSEGAL